VILHRGGDLATLITAQLDAMGLALFDLDDEDALFAHAVSSSEP